MARPWCARCYGVARQREGSRQNGIGGWFSLSLGAWVPKNLARQRMQLWLMASAAPSASPRPDRNGAMLLDRLGPPGFRFNDFRAPRLPYLSPLAREGPDGQAVVCPLLRGSSPTRWVAPKRHREARACFLSGISGWFSLSLGAWVPNKLPRRRMVSAGAMLLDRLGPPGSGFRFIDFRAPRSSLLSAIDARARGR